MHSETITYKLTLPYIFIKMRNFTRQHNFTVYSFKMSLTPKNISGKESYCEPSEFESHNHNGLLTHRADSDLIKTHSDTFHLYDRSEVLWQTLSFKNLAVPQVKSSHKNKPERVRCLMLGPINATDGHSFGHKISATCQ